MLWDWIILLIQLYDSFRVFFFKTLYGALPRVKCVFTRPKNLCTKLVLTFLLYGGLYQIIFIFLRAGFCLFGAGSGSLYFSSCLYPLAARASWYIGLAFSNSASDDDYIAISLLLIDMGICFSTIGGWLDFALTYRYRTGYF